MFKQANQRQAAARWVAATVCPLTVRATQAQAAWRATDEYRPMGGAFNGNEEGCPLSEDELRVLRREMTLPEGVL